SDQRAAATFRVSKKDCIAADFPFGNARQFAALERAAIEMKLSPTNLTAEIDPASGLSNTTPTSQCSFFLPLRLCAFA
ncbi:MAG: hypothetical protein ACM3U2_10005, partial [Deltaproteobacteria bacterium]